MNRIFRVVWSEGLVAWYVVSELGKGRAKSSCARCASVIVAALISLVSLPAAAGCVAVGSNITCTGVDQTTTVGTGPAETPGTSVEVQSGALVSTVDSPAISLGDNANIIVRSNAIVENNAGNPSSGNYPGAGANTLEVSTGSTITVEQGGIVRATGSGNSNNDSEAINFFGAGGYTVTNNGTISSLNATMWFQPGTTGTGVIVNNGTMEAGVGGANFGQAGVLGNSGSVALDFTNTGNVIGSLGFGSGDDALHIYTGSSITGNISGGGGNNLLTLNSVNPADTSTFAPNSLSGFQTLENQSGIWTLNVALPASGITSTTVQGGTLILGTDASAYTGTMNVDAPGILQTSAEFAPHAITDNGLVRFAQPTNAAYAGVVSGTGRIEKTGAGTLSLTQNQTFTGATTIAGGTLRAGAANVFSVASVHSVATGATLDLNGFNQTIAALNNSGTVRLLGTTPGTTLTVAGDYVGNNGQLQIGTELGADASPTDRLIIGGNASGNTTVEVSNLGGLGAQTTGDGIQLISIGGTTTANAFALAGGHVDAGAYEYRLFAGNAAGAGSNWYLRSLNNTVTAFRSEVALNAALPGLLAQADLTMLGTMHQRIGDNNAELPSQEERHVWGRLIGERIKTDQDGDVSPSTEGSFAGLQLGSDLLHFGAHRFGIYGGYLHGDSDVRGFASGLQNNRVGNLNLDNKYLGAYWTYQNDIGWYADTVLQEAWYGGDTSSRGGSNNDIEGNDTQLSLEVGKSIPLNAIWTLEPQAQLIVSRMDIDSQHISGAYIDQDTDTTLTSRLGVRLKGDYATSRGRMQPYARFNVWHGSNGAYTTAFTGLAGSTDIRTNRGYTSGQVAIGMTWMVSNSVNLYGEIGHMFSLDIDGQQVRQPVMATVGLRMDW